MLTTASQFTPRARSLHTQHVAKARVLGTVCAHGYRQQQQTRNFRWGLWSHLDDDFSREFRRQQRMLKHKYSEQLNRRLSWEKHPFSEDSRHALKRMMKSYWLSPYSSGRFCDEAGPTRHETVDNKNGSRAGRNIEDVERGVMDHLIFGENEDPVPLDQHRNRHLKRRRARKLKYNSDDSYGQPVELDGYVIDPITNRKVAKPTPSSNIMDCEDIPVKTFKDYRSQFTSPDVVLEQHSASRQPGLSHTQIDGSARSIESRDYTEGRSEDFDYVEDESRVSPENDKAQSLGTQNTRYNGTPSYKPVNDPAPDTNLASSVDGLSGGPHDLFQHRNAMEAHGTFSDLQPPQESIDDSGYRSMVADEIASRVEDVEPRDLNQTKSATSQTDGGRNAETVDELDQEVSRQYEGKPLGFREDFVKPEVLRRFRSTIDAVKPGDFPEPTVEDLRTKYGTAELKQYTSVRYVEPGQSSGRTDDKTKACNKSSTTTYQEADGLVFAQMEQDQEALNAKIEYQAPQHIESEDNSNGQATGHDTLERLASVKQGHGRKSGIVQDTTSGKGDHMVHEPESPASLLPDLERLASVKQGQGKQSNYREMLESLMSRHEQLSDAHDQEATLAVKLAKVKNQEVDAPKRKVTGNYVRDFPEEFEKSWTQTLSSMPTEEQTSYETEITAESEAMEGGLEGAFGGPSPSRIQPALDRCGGAKTEVDQDNQGTNEGQSTGASSKEASEVQIKQFDSPGDAKDEVIPAIQEETSNAREDEVKSHAAQESHEASEETTSIPQNEPILYKILAYDPIMQKINMAETTSFVPDFTSALSPADALLRISHPTKFFPHFASLEAEGFEIASGSGDVLVFRKVRPSRPSEQIEETPTETTLPAAEPPSSSSSSAEESPVNPIDMTGRPRVVSPASANFASPTGYVKYENLPETEADKLPPPPPPSSSRVAYNINLRREEPVFSGPKHSFYGEQRRRKSLGHRLLIGGVWVAGISYGLGVVSEYFTTGGMDGMGPQSL
ncbi:hypothetical protein N0V93_007698 [Gnomoniopsis smithogilvyi]|uniref:Uncharacterized protein n=1 Tax=Gnomoniopsis smithogilvyi TaxID=1191159 RepID=A0A9W8YKC5_9PEZI|nr:hypothetical protein N0V93_007698 [Gnomoniopsis smithogilvyi]